MKRTILCVLLASCALSFMFAQGRNRQGQDFSNRNPPAPVSISGNLTIAQGMIAVSSGDITYLTGGLNRFTGFIDGLKEGAAVTLEGFARPNPQNDKVQFMRVQKMTLNGKEYELATPRPEISPRMGPHAYPRPKASPPQNAKPRPRAAPYYQPQQPPRRGR